MPEWAKLGLVLLGAIAIEVLLIWLVVARAFRKRRDRPVRTVRPRFWDWPGF